MELQPDTTDGLIAAAFLFILSLSFSRARLTKASSAFEPHLSVLIGGRPSGRNGQTRTGDFLLPRQVRYHLRYVPMKWLPHLDSNQEPPESKSGTLPIASCGMVGGGGIEPPRVGSEPTGLPLAYPPVMARLLGVEPSSQDLESQRHPVTDV